MRDYNIKCTGCNTVLIILTDCQNPGTPVEMAAGTQCGICGSEGDLMQVIDVTPE